MRVNAKALASERWRTEAFRAVVDAGRRTKTQVQRAVHKQMATRRYSMVTSNTRGTPKRADLAYEIYAFIGGQRIEEYKGLQALAGRRQGGRQVQRRSHGWRSRHGPVGCLECRRACSSDRSQPTAVSSLCCQAATALGRRRHCGRSAGRNSSRATRRGASLRPVAPTVRSAGCSGRLCARSSSRMNSLATFRRVGPTMLEQKVMKRIGKYMRL